MRRSRRAHPQEQLITTDKRSPLVLDTHELSRRPGTMREVARVVPAPADMGTAVIGVPEGADLTLGLRLESVLEGVLVSGVVRGTAVGECVRCLDEVRDEVTVRVQELFVYPERAQAADESGDDEAEDEPELTDDLADLEPVVRDSLVTALPFQPLCRQDCPGLCSECGARLADDPEHHHDVVDPRWAALQTMLEESSVSDETKES
ncbi:uncharacterized protein BCE75_108131 [Isoptericola sp. CG 20/1183]|uniref:DUF177 domain-containing protein n=1 Tax=Isoptericola halotolerans TaxID=300560 RepID=A0ABX5ECD0_9MICO|nr:uncharacterized protein BCL65_108132 [Isoptericola halotolerans]PRZ05890.1 uncharacterized protein BCE75_108131 [Isoptericola sp. CG 20/1183]